MRTPAKFDKQTIIEKLPKKYRELVNDAVYEVEYDGACDGPYWAYVYDDYEFGTTGCHTSHEWTMKEFLDSFKTIKKI